MTNEQQHKHILFFDGVCVFCNFWVQFIFERDRKKSIFFAPLQGTNAKNLLPENFINSLDTVVFWNDGQLLTKSDAILEALKLIRYSPEIIWLLSIIPHFFRNKIYDFIANHRYKLFGKLEVCPIPSDSLKAQLLD